MPRNHSDRRCMIASNARRARLIHRQIYSFLQSCSGGPELFESSRSGDTFADPYLAKLCQDTGVTLSLLYSIAIAILILTVGVFVLAFRFALREAMCEGYGGVNDLPRARIRGAGLLSNNRWHRGAGRGLVVRQVHVLQASLVAVGISAVFLMMVCMTSICVALIASAV